MGIFGFRCGKATLEARKTNHGQHPMGKGIIYVIQCEKKGFLL